MASNNEYAPTSSSMVTKLGVGTLDTRHWTAIIVIGALLLLVLINRGFRGVNVLGVRASVS
jgi:hypothetical protein